jgi:hypothetical protein
MNEQIEAIKEFENFLIPLRIVYSLSTQYQNKGNNSESSFSLRTFLHRQKLLLHGYESKMLKYIPKVKLNFIIIICMIIKRKFR